MSDLRVCLSDAFSHVSSLGNADLLCALECAVRGAVCVERGWSSVDEEVSDKGLGDLVSAVDVAAERAMLDYLGSQRSHDLILSEETRKDTLPIAGHRMWIVDPLDGTASFLFRFPPQLVSVLVALYDCDTKHVTVAVEVFPVQKRALYAVRGGGSFCNGQRLRVPESVRVPLSKSWVNINQYSNVAFESPAVATARQKLRTAGPSAARLVTTLPASSGFAYLMLLDEARLSAVIHDNDAVNLKQGPWDTAAPQLIIEEAGGVFWNAVSGQPYDPLVPTMIIAAATEELAQEIRKKAMEI